MAKIVHSETAPAEVVHYTFAGVEFDLGGKSKSFESDDPLVLANAEAHPWLTVDYPKVEASEGTFREQLAPEDDHLSAYYKDRLDVNDPEVVAAAEQAKIAPLAVESGTDQSEEVTTGPVAETLAAADNDTSKKGGK